MNQSLLDALVAEGVISAADGEGAAVYAKRRQIHVEEALVQMGLLDEAQLLKFQANYYKTYFVSTKKLSAAPIHDSLLRLVTHKLAAKLCVFPVRFDSKTQELSVLMVQPDDLDVLKNVQFATRVPKVRALVARPAAIQAAIRYHFEGDDSAFGQIKNTTTGTGLSVERDRRRTLSYEQASLSPPSRDNAVSMPPTDESGVGLPPVPVSNRPKRKTIRRTADGPPTGQHAMPPQQSQQPPQHQVVAPSPYATQAPVQNGLPSLPPMSQQVVHGFPMQPQYSQPPGMMPDPTATLPGHQLIMHPGVNQPGMQNSPARQTQPDLDPLAAPDLQSAVSKVPAGVAVHDYLETVNVLVALLENDRGDLRGHSVSVARICRRLCERLGLKQEDMDAVIVAAYLHDIGKTSAYHLTALNVAEYEAHRTQARKSYLTPVRIFESVRLPGNVNTILTHLYERFDGQGFPDRLAGKEICLGSRVLSIVETYADLVGHTGNPFRKKLTSQEAWDVLAKFKGKIFDPGLVDVFKLVVLGDDLRAKLLADSRRALLVDSDAEDTTVLELRLAEHGFDVTIARNSIEAQNELINDFEAVICEVELKPLSGFELLQNARAGGNDVPWIFHSKNAEGEMVQRGFELGAADFITKPASPDVVALKVTRVLDGARHNKRRTGGVSGSLTEMALPDMVQILFHGRKSGKLTITADGKHGEILFNEGMIFDASFGEVGQEEAFYEMLRLRDGDFELDPNFRATRQVIQVSPESLLLEGMRRFDEDSR